MNRIKNKLYSAFLCALALVMLVGAVPCFAKEQKSKAEDIFDGILEYHSADDIQKWIDGYLTENAGLGAEWYAIALSQSGNYDFSSYEKALINYLEENRVTSASSRLKYALCLAAVGSKSGYITSALDESVGEQGLMSYVFGLHLLNNRYKSEKHTASELISKILDLQLADGGFSIAGQNGDVDATAMAMQALAPHCKTNEEVRAAVDKALVWLSEKQLDSGDFVSFGVVNPQSAAQVIVALSALGIDVESDERFIKNGNDLFDVIEKYRLPSGGICHSEGGEVNHTASAQTFYATVAYMRFSDGRPPLYILDRADPENVEQKKTDSKKTPSLLDNYKVWVSLTIVCLGIAFCVVLILIKKRNPKNFIAVLLICAVALTIVWVTNIRSADDYYNGDDVKKENVIGRVTLTIRCDSVAGRAEHIPADGVILGATEFDIAEGDSVYTVLTDAAKKYKIRIENDGNALSAYISGINSLYEFDYGDLSGWTYKVNGESPLMGIGEYKLKSGDRVEIYYTTDLGEGLK